MKMVALALLVKGLPFNIGCMCGSAIGAGTWAFSKHFTLSTAIRTNCTDYDSEVTATHLALIEVRKRGN